MGFPDSVKLAVKRKANFTCCWCQDRRNKVDVHHIVPQCEGGSDDEDNAAPLCGSCHDLLGRNPDLRKEIRLRRDHWYGTCFRTVELYQQPPEVDGLTIKVFSLLTKVQSGFVPLSQCIAEALAVAQKTSNRSLEAFCRSELLGWTAEVGKGTDPPTYRLAEVFVSATARINMQSFAWGQNVGSVFEYMRQDSEHFHPKTFALLYPVSWLESQLELQRNADPSKAVWTIESKLRDIDPDTKHPDVPVIGYVRTDILQTILDSIRQELTKHLLGMLPRIEEDSVS
jgi:hypothetical protein